MLEMTMANGFDSFVVLLQLRYGMTYFGRTCMMFIVSIVSPMEMHAIRKNKSSISCEDVQDRLFELMNENFQDLHVVGTVIFRDWRFTDHCFLTKRK
jgi:hypothetical protein